MFVAGAFFVFATFYFTRTIAAIDFRKTDKSNA